MTTSINKALLLALCLSISASTANTLAANKHKLEDTGVVASEKSHKSKKLSKQERKQLAFLGRGKKQKDQKESADAGDAIKQPAPSTSTSPDAGVIAPNPIATPTPFPAPVTIAPETKPLIVPVNDVQPVVATPVEKPQPIIVTESKAKIQTELVEPSRPLPDGALISVLKDLSRALKESPEAAKIEDPYQKAALSIATLALSKALDNPTLPSDRIITSSVLRQAQSYISTEAWDSGDLVVADGGCHVSMNALWAKKSEGLVNLSLAGNCGGRVSSNGTKVNDFVFVLSGKSAISKGFDIQSQQEVTFWMGKLISFAVDTGASNNNISSADLSGKKTAPVLNAVLTDKSRQYQADLKVYHKKKELLAQKAEEDRKKLEEKAAAEQIAAAEKSKTQVDSDAKAKADLLAQVKAEVEAKLKAESSKVESAQAAARNIPQESQLVSAVTSLSTPSTIVSPDKAVAGQYMTVAVINGSKMAEAGAVLSFNGQTVEAGQDGKARFLVPDNSMPGPSLQVSLLSNPQGTSRPVVVLQPLQTPAYPQLPRIDAVSPAVRSGGTIHVDGHNFDGVSDRNRVIIDGVYDAQVVVSSPVQLKADLPVNLAPGKHSISIGTGDLRSNPGQFEVIAVEVQPDAKEVERDAFTKLIVKAVGTTNPVKVRLTNKTPDVIRLAKGNDIVVTTAGGNNNQVVLSVQRFIKAPYQVQAELE